MFVLAFHLEKSNHIYLFFYNIFFVNHKYLKNKYLN